MFPGWARSHQTFTGWSRNSKELPLLQNKRQMWAFLGFSTYYHRFILWFAELTSPLTDTIKGRGNETINWDMRKREALVGTNAALYQDMVLQTPDSMQSFILQVNTSGRAVGVVLSQKIDGTERLVAYASRKLNKHEQRHATKERECLALYGESDISDTTCWGISLNLLWIMPH